MIVGVLRCYLSSESVIRYCICRFCPLIYTLLGTRNIFQLPDLYHLPAGKKIRPTPDIVRESRFFFLSLYLNKTQYNIGGAV